MSLEAAKSWLGHRWVLHPQYQPQPNHSSYAHVNVGLTHLRVRHRLRQERRSFVGEVEMVRQRLRLIHNERAA